MKSFCLPMISPPHRKPTFGGLDKLKSSGPLPGPDDSGWVWLLRKGKKLSITSTPNQDNPLMKGRKPILALDVWEHAC